MGVIGYVGRLGGLWRLPLLKKSTPACLPACAALLCSGPSALVLSCLVLSCPEQSCTVSCPLPLASCLALHYFTLPDVARPELSSVSLSSCLSRLLSNHCYTETHNPGNHKVRSRFPPPPPSPKRKDAAFLPPPVNPSQRYFSNPEIGCGSVEDILFISSAEQRASPRPSTLQPQLVQEGPPPGRRHHSLLLRLLPLPLPLLLSTLFRARSWPTDLRVSTHITILHQRHCCSHRHHHHC